MTTDWNKQSEEMIRGWLGAQQKMWENWLGVVQNIQVPQTTGTWEKSVETWHESVKKALESQTTWVQHWANSVSATPGATKEATEAANKALEVSKHWTETQKQIWDSWFETVRKTDPASPKIWTEAEVQKVQKVWQESAQKALEAQAEWTRLLTGAIQPPPKS
jgi:hypothetical protein